MYRDVKSYVKSCVESDVELYVKLYVELCELCVELCVERLQLCLAGKAGRDGPCCSGPVTRLKLSSGPYSEFGWLDGTLHRCSQTAAVYHFLAVQCTAEAAWELHRAAGVGSAYGGTSLDHNRYYHVTESLKSGFHTSWLKATFPGRLCRAHFDCQGPYPVSMTKASCSL